MNILYACLAFVLLLLVVKRIHHRNKKNKTVKINDERCARCGSCLVKCRRNVLEMVNGSGGLHVEVKDEASCTGCGDCVPMCTFGAIELVDRW